MNTLQHKATVKSFNLALNSNLTQESLLSLYHKLKELKIIYEDLVIYKKLLEDLIVSAKTDKKLISDKEFGICNSLMYSVYSFNENYNTKLIGSNSYEIIQYFAKHFYNNVSVELLWYSYPIPKSMQDSDLWSNEQLEYRINFMEWIVKQIDEMLQYNV